ncbi:MAG: hypothetical protein FGM33_03180 [Candidatus Kapabacteria bacterium]|nr:hypothetical protein [Candidatus Kapabacteria bacterium]
MKLIASIVFMIISMINEAMACPACKDGFTKGGSNATVGDAYSLSVIVMLSVPVIILTVAIVTIARRLRQHPNSVA